MWVARERDERPFAIIPGDDASATWIARRSAPHPEGVALTSAAVPAGSAPYFRIYSIAAPADANGHRSSLVGELIPSEAGAGEPSSARLDQAAGVILLLPVASMAASPEMRDACVTWLTTTLARLPEQAGAAPPAVSIPVALCLTQTDEAPDASRRDAARWLESFGSEPMRALRAHCARFALFKISSLGRTPRRRDGVDVLVGTPEPRGILAPIRWILADPTEEAAA